VGSEEVLRAFRRRFYGSLRRRADALFELADALLCAGTVPSPVHLSLAPVHRRGWGSLYAALNKGRIDEGGIRQLLSHGTLAEEGVQVYAVDVSPWPRCDAEASPERCYLYHPFRHSAGQPIVAGWAYQLVAQLGFERDSWVTPVDARRVPSDRDANDVAARQVMDLVSRLSHRPEAPLFVFDAGYDPVRLQSKLEGWHAQIVVRLHSGRTFYAEPELPPKRPVGRPFRHGRSSRAKIQALGPGRPQSTTPGARITGRCASGRGRGCIPRPARPPSATGARRPPSSKAQWYW
jgi:hypothetical protein